MFDNLTDNQLIALHKQGNLNAFERISERYKWLVKSVCRSYFLTGGDDDDLLQEGFLGLLKAVNTYDESKNTAFKTFAYTCISSNVKTAVRKDCNNSNKALNESVSLTAISFLETENLEDVIIEKEGKEETENEIKNLLSQLEYKIFRLWLGGHSYGEISEITGKTDKAVDNAIQRIKKKLKG
ncbi:MAG: sigma-70 family RNA polymerase sigma factor [Clostridia bacterium]|nr:sigma-70 family RNA polymerase sigma factor [Clostridia bacterium]